MKNIFFGVLFLTGLAAGQGLVTHSILPSDTDPAISQWNQAHRAWVDTAVPPNGKLFVFFEGTGASPEMYANVCETAANLGYKAISISYANTISINLEVCGGLDSSCYEKSRREILFGEDLHPKVDVDTAHAAENRLIKLLIHLNKIEPGQAWDRFLIDARTLDYARIAFSGHSQGAGHAGLLGKFFRVDRVIMLDGGRDWARWRNGSAIEEGPAPWVVRPGATPPQAIFGFSHWQDPSFFEQPAMKQVRAWEAYGIDIFGPLVLIDTAKLPFSGTHMLTTNLEHGCPAGMFRSPYHNATSVDTCTPKTPNGLPRYRPVWAYMMTSTSAPLKPEALSRAQAPDLFVYPNPGKGVVRFRLHSPVSGPVDFSVWDIGGHRVFSRKTSGEISWAGESTQTARAASGVYFVRIKAANRVFSRQILWTP